MSEYSLLIQEYYKSSQFQKTKDLDFSWIQWNPLCWDTLTVYLNIKNDKISAYAYDGEPAKITKAAAEFLGEFLIHENIKKILTRDAAWIKDEWFEVSQRRERSSVTALLAVRNIIHQYLDDGERDEYEDLLD